ncbi:hypothetical protein BDV96DRAFT_322445 [Lophiotrema nucula]|uniref:Uncharacterized protein n=1 Tax=Lophiotrema nucula TaxID=690887 RepID=A0A6A5ZN12_9PLEO|nr:hypothetical protein BDV96DRAFT_322445 [Lophiotrema nucula]
MSLSTSEWQWDPTRRKHYYYAKEDECWAYDNGERVYDEDPIGPLIDFHSGRYSLVQDLEVSNTPLFSGIGRNLHRIDPNKERISLLVCQHVLRPVQGYCCAEPFAHRHVQCGETTTYNNPSMCLYQEHGKKKQTLIIDVGTAYVTRKELISILKEATDSYRSNVLHQTSGYGDSDARGWDELHMTELKHYKWLQTSSFYTTIDEYVWETFYISGITCPHCHRWTKLAFHCCRCSKPLHDQLEGVTAESAAEVAAGVAGGALITGGIASFLFLGLLAMV